MKSFLQKYEVLEHPSFSSPLFFALLCSPNSSHSSLIGLDSSAPSGSTPVFYSFALSSGISQCLNMQESVLFKLRKNLKSRQEFQVNFLDFNQFHLFLTGTITHEIIDTELYSKEILGLK